MEHVNKTNLTGMTIGFDLPEASKLERSITVMICLCFLFMAMSIVTALICLFGPQYIYYDRDVGMTFFQFIEAYPGPLTSINIAITLLCSHKYKKIMAQQDGLLGEKIQSVLHEHKISVPDDHVVIMQKLDTPSGFQILITHK